MMLGFFSRACFHSCIFCGEVTVDIFACFLMHLLILVVLSVLYIFWIQVRYQVEIGKCSLSIYGFLLFFIASLEEQTFSILLEVQFIICSLWIMFLVLKLTNFYLSRSHKFFSHALFWKFHSLGFTFELVIYFFFFVP